MWSAIGAIRIHHNLSQTVASLVQGHLINGVDHPMGHAYRALELQHSTNVPRDSGRFHDVQHLCEWFGGAPDFPLAHQLRCR